MTMTNGTHGPTGQQADSDVDLLYAFWPGTTPPPPPLPEAPASVNCHITIEGRQVQLTLRDRDETRLLERLTTLLKQYPVPAAGVC
jgi:hypothetical protein